MSPSTTLTSTIKTPPQQLWLPTSSPFPYPLPSCPAHTDRKLENVRQDPSRLERNRHLSLANQIFSFNNGSGTCRRQTNGRSEWWRSIWSLQVSGILAVANVLGWAKRIRIVFLINKNNGICFSSYRKRTRICLLSQLVSLGASRNSRRNFKVSCYEDSTVLIAGSYCCLYSW